MFLYGGYFSRLGSADTFPKSRYTIGGWIPGTNETFLNTWEPIFADYLTVTIGKDFLPPVQFDVVAVDYSPEFSSTTLANAGEIDFICKLHSGSDLGVYILMLY